MHISEGVLSAPVLIGGAAFAGTGAIIGLKSLDYGRIMTVAIMTSTFFVASLIHVPLGPGSIHLVLGGLMGVILGWACFPAILVALFLQSVFFQYGGLLVLGANTVIIAVPALLCFLVFRPWLRRGGKKRATASFLCGFLAVLLSSLLAALALAATDEGFLRTAQLVVVSHIPMMIIEGCVTMFAFGFLARVQPDFIRTP